MLGAALQVVILSNVLLLSVVQLMSFCSQISVALQVIILSNVSLLSVVQLMSFCSVLLYNLSFCQMFCCQVLLSLCNFDWCCSASLQSVKCYYVSSVDQLISVILLSAALQDIILSNVVLPSPFMSFGSH